MGIRIKDGVPVVFGDKIETLDVAIETIKAQDLLIEHFVDLTRDIPEYHRAHNLHIESLINTLQTTNNTARNYLNLVQKLAWAARIDYEKVKEMVDINTKFQNDLQKQIDKDKEILDKKRKNDNTMKKLIEEHIFIYERDKDVLPSTG